MAQNKNEEAQQLRDLIKDCPRSYDSKNVYFKVPLDNGTEETYAVRSEDFSLYLHRCYFNTYGEHPSKGAMNDTITYLQSDLLSNRAKNPKYRVAKKGGVIYIDLQDANDNVVEVTADGWKIASKDNSMFKRAPDQLELAEPVLKGGDIDLLRKYVNVSDEDYLKLKAFIVSCFIPRIQHPILSVIGEYGTGKSTLLEIVKLIVDPSLSLLTSLDGRMDNVELTLSSSHFVAFDNLSSLSQAQSNAFCMTVTGAHSDRRKKYSDTEQVRITFDAITSMNGIEQVIKKPDLAQRCLFVETLPEVRNHTMVKEELMAEFMEDLPLIFGGILDILVTSLSLHAIMPPLKKYQRLSDFHKYSVAIAEAMEPGLGEVIQEALIQNEIKQKLVSGSDVELVGILLRFLGKEAQWEGRTETLYENLENLIENYETAGKIFSKHTLPASVNSFSRKLRSNDFLMACQQFNLHCDVYRAMPDNLSCVRIFKDPGDSTLSAVTAA